MDEAGLKLIGGGREGGRKGDWPLALKAGRGETGHHSVLKGKNLGRGGFDAVLKLEQVLLLCRRGFECGRGKGAGNVKIAVVIGFKQLGRVVVVVVYAQAPDLLGNGHSGCHVYGRLEGL